MNTYELIIKVYVKADTEREAQGKFAQTLGADAIAFSIEKTQELRPFRQ